MLSIAKLNANRSNAARSTGPCTARGIARSSRNAVQHGLAATSAVVIAGIEDAADYEYLVEAIIGDLNPRGMVETLLAERVAVLFWRLRRVLRYETESLSQGQAAITPSLSDLAAQYRNRENRERIAAALGHLLLPHENTIDDDTVAEIFQAFADFLPEVQLKALSAAPCESASSEQHETGRKHTVRSVTDVIRSAEKQLGHPNLIALVYERCLGNNRSWDRFDGINDSSSARQRTEALLIQVERATLVDRYEPRLRRDLSRTFKDFHDLQSRRGRCAQDSSNLALAD